MSSNDRVAGMDPMPVLYASESDLALFLAGASPQLDYVDSEGSGRVTWSDEAAEEFSPDEVRQLHGHGLGFWVEHPTTGKQVSVTVRIRR